ncbi:MAG: oligosaccharide flippase family protein, partial [Anaeroplasmataceae bacterium]|nr:oligosaccharide flippase family protein [Anaeroplasmataceae bacterium]
MTSKKQKDLINGSLFKKMLLFSLPLMFSNLLQVLFNMSDVSVVGPFATKESLGSVGSTTTYVVLFTGVLIGIGSG